MISQLCEYISHLYSLLLFTYSPQVIYDTGSSYLWVFGLECTHECGPERYDHTSSSSYIEDGTPFQMEYGIGSASGYAAVDDVALGDVIVKHQVFGVAVRVTGNHGITSGIQGKIGTI